MEKINLKDFLPHRKPILLVDELISLHKNNVETNFLIDQQCMFVENSFLNEAGLIENMAQTCSIIIGSGFFDGDEGDGVKVIGYITSIKKCDIFELPQVGDSLKTIGKLVSKMDTDEYSICSIEGQSFVNDKIVLNCNLNLLIRLTHES